MSKKIIGVLLIITGVSFLTWKIISYKTSFGLSMLLNISGFLVVSFGFALFKAPVEKSITQDNQNKTNLDNIQPTKKAEEKKTEDHSRFMPK